MAFIESKSVDRVPSAWIYLDKGADGVIYCNPSSRMVKKVYPRHSFSEIEAYRLASQACSEHAYNHPFERSIDGRRFVLQDIIPVIGVERESDSWAAVSSFVAGPHLTASASDPELFGQLVLLLETAEQEALSAFHEQFRADPQSSLRRGIDRMLHDASSRLAKVIKNPGVDLIYWNTKIRHYPEEDFMRLIVTDISPSVDRIIRKGRTFFSH